MRFTRHKGAQTSRPADQQTSREVGRPKRWTKRLLLITPGAKVMIIMPQTLVKTWLSRADLAPHVAREMTSPPPPVAPSDEHICNLLTTAGLSDSGCQV